MAGIEHSTDSLKRVTPDEMYGRVGSAEDPLRALIPTFGDRLIESLVAGLRSGVRRAELELIGQGDQPQTLKVKIERDGEGDTLRVTMEGSWEDRSEIPVGRPIYADFEGKFFRFRKPADPDPIAEVGNILEPREAYGLAFRGKSDYWYLRLPPTEFPKGGRITAFMHTNGLDVQRGQSILLYVDPL